MQDLKLEMQHLKIDAEGIRSKFKEEIEMIQKGASQHMSFLQSLDSKRHMDTEGTICNTLLLVQIRS